MYSYPGVEDVFCGKGRVITSFPFCSFKLVLLVSLVRSVERSFTSTGCLIHTVQVAVDYLVENLKKTLYLEKEESVPVYELLSVVAAQYNMTAEHYCEVRGETARTVYSPRRCADSERNTARLGYTASALMYLPLTRPMHPPSSPP